MQYIIVGIGGQGILFTSRVLGTIAIDGGLSVIGNEVHGMAQRGGSVISHLKMGSYRSPLVSEGHADVLLAFDQTEAIRNLQYLREGGTLVLNIDDPTAFANVHLQKFISARKIVTCQFSGYKILDEHMQGRYLFLNVLILGAASGAGIKGIEPDSVRAALKKLAPAKYLNDNMKVFELGLRAAAERP